MGYSCVALLVAWLSLCGIGGSLAAETSPPPAHPSLLTTPVGLERARQRVRDEAWAQRVFARLAEAGANLVHDTLSAADRHRIDDFFDRAFAAVLTNDQDWIREGWGARFNNHYAHHKLFIGTYGLFSGKPEHVAYALESEQGFRELIEYAARDDGLWFESSLNYHFAGIVPIAEFAAELAHTGHPFDLWNHSFANGRCLRDFFTAPIATLFPDQTIPMIGDTYGHRAALKGSHSYFEAFNAVPDARISWVLQGAEPPAVTLFLPRLPADSYPPPEMKTRLWPEHGYVTLRPDRYGRLRVTVDCGGKVRDFSIRRLE